MKITMFESYEEMSQQAAERVAAHIAEHPDTLLCFAAGETPMGMFRILAAMQEDGRIDLSQARFAGLDEWVGLGPNDTGSCIQVMHDAFYRPANIPLEHIHVFDGLAADLTEECQKMENWITACGGIGMTVLGIGMNGHIGFNEPDVPVQNGCIVCDLDDTTKAVSIKYFGQPLPVRQGISIGLGSLIQAKEVVLLANGARKAEIVHATVHGPVSNRVPSTLFRDHLCTTLLLDREAAIQIQKE